MRSISCGQLLSCNNRGPNGCDCDAEKMPFLLLREINYFAFGMILGSADGCQADPVLLRHFPFSTGFEHEDWDVYVQHYILLHV